MKIQKKMGTGLVACLLMIGASSANAFECKVKDASMAKPGGFPDRALTMIVPYGPAGGSGQVASAMAEAVTGEGGDLLSAAQSSVENDYEKTQKEIVNSYPTPL